MQMTEQEYKEKLNQLELKHREDCKKLHYEFGMSQVKFKKGDIICDHRWTLIIDKITVNKSLGLPEPVYHGRELKKDLSPKKINNEVCIYGNAGIELIKSC